MHKHVIGNRSKREIMNTHADKTQENKSHSHANGVSQMQSGGESTFQFVDNRPEAVAQRKLQEMANNSPQTKQAAQLQAMANGYSAQQQQTIQNKPNSYQPLTLLRNKNEGKEVAQLFSYQSINPIKGVPMSVRVEDSGTKLTIIDNTQTEQNVGTLNGFIDYYIEGDELKLDHFEAHPPGAGLGTLLMFELSQVAVRQGISTIAVNTPALSAMGAYKAFGGKPRNEEQHEEYKGMYLSAMQNDTEIHKRMVNEEAEAYAESEVYKEKYFNPELGSVGEGNLFIGAKGDYKNEHSGDEDYERAADLKALSAQLIYNSSELGSKTGQSFSKKWNVV